MNPCVKKVYRDMLRIKPVVSQHQNNISYYWVFAEHIINTNTTTEYKIHTDLTITPQGLKWAE